MAASRRPRDATPAKPLPAKPPREEPKKRGFAAYIDGWQPALVGVLLAGSTALLAVPRPVEPKEIPEPRVDGRALAAVERGDEALAEQADRERLDVDVRALGTALFSYGEIDAGPNHTAIELERRNVLEAAARAIKLGPGPLVALRAHHLRSFLEGVRHFEQTGEETDKLKQVGGGFLKRLGTNGWVEGHTVLLDRSALAAAFKRHWCDVTELHGGPFELTLDETRALYRFFLQHPLKARSPFEAALPPLPVDPTFKLRVASSEVLGADAVTQAQYRLKKLEELRAIDPSYPVDLARGVVLYQMQRYPLAVESFRRQNEAAPDGPYALRVQNYLLASLAKAQE